VDALEMLRGHGGRETIGAPYLVLLDLNLPRMGGIEFLTHLRRDPDLRRSLVFVMTTSLAEEDRARAYDENVAGFLSKQRSGQGLIEAASMLNDYLRTIEFPD
jgi:CheY-like chemotaxis protein